jgi:hypothetical protein
LIAKTVSSVRIPVSAKLLFQILLALLFGLLAGFVHYRTNQVKQSKYAIASRDLKVGERLKTGADGNLKLIGIPVAPGGVSLDKNFIDETRLPLVEGMVTNREIPSGSLVLRSDFEILRELKPEAGMVALNVPLIGVKFEPSFLRVGEQVHFVVEQSSEGTAEPSFTLLGPFKLLAVEDGTTQGQASERDTPATVCIEVPQVLDANATRLLSEIRNQGIVALAFGAKSATGIADGKN